MIKKVLIANRGEIAVRAIRACKEMGIKAVAIYSTADKEAMHVKIADEAICIGGNYAHESYTNKQAVLSAAVVTNCDAIFPGYGFLSENADFAEMVENHGFKFIGPNYKHIRAMGDKISAKKLAKELGLPLVPGGEGECTSLEMAKETAERYGYPVVIKASGGGGGKGIRLVETPDEMEAAFDISKNEAKNFATDALYIEKYIVNPRHIEIQILGDKNGNVLHLFERECSLQRNHQKILEEAGSIAITEKEREEICTLTVNAMKKLGYYSAGTVEYLYSEGKFYFMEMNTRVQVEHTVTESVVGIDIIYEMIRIVEDDYKLKHKQSDIKMNGHAIECRILAEDPKTFAPSPGKINTYHAPNGLGVRVDTSIYAGYKIPPYYDSMIAKLIVVGRNRKHCINRTKRALEEFIIEGVKTSIPLHIELMDNEDFVSGNFNIKWLEDVFLKDSK